jgi:hypothetical protein
MEVAEISVPEDSSESSSEKTPLESYKFDKIVFFHLHVNGDCFQSRVIVNYIISKTKDLNIEYYYTALRAICSHALDLGILDENFNKYSIPNYSLPCYIENNILYINIWIGFFNNINNLCVLCMKNILINYNLLISEINKTTNLNLEFINNQENPFISFNYSYYDVDHLNLFINEKKNIYKKIILIYNINLTTFIALLKIDHSFYINILSEKYKDFLFITFNETNLNKDNVLSINKIYNLSNKILPSSFAIQFSYLAELSDKVILLPTGPSLFCINDKNNENKFSIIFDIIYNYFNTPYCIINKDLNNDILCDDKKKWNVKKIIVDVDDDEMRVNVCNEVEKFITRLQ